MFDFFFLFFSKKNSDMTRTMKTTNIKKKHYQEASSNDTCSRRCCYGGMGIPYCFLSLWNRTSSRPLYLAKASSTVLNFSGLFCAWEDGDGGRANRRCRERFRQHYLQLMSSSQWQKKKSKKKSHDFSKIDSASSREPGDSGVVKINRL